MDIVNDDDHAMDKDHNAASQVEGSSEFSMPTQWDSRLHKRARSKPLTFPTQQERIIQPSALLDQLNVIELQTNGYHNNCLWFSVQLATGLLSAPKQFEVYTEQKSDVGRLQIHQELLRALPAATCMQVGTNDVWWAGFSRARAEQVYEQELMMCEAHIFAFASLIRRPICIVDTRSCVPGIRAYRPGYSVKGLDISLAAAQRLRVREPQCVWVRLHGYHYTALVATVQCD